MKLLLKWLLYSAALLALTSVYSGVEIRSFGAAMIAALVIGLLNSVLRPVLVLLTLPTTGIPSNWLCSVLLMADININLMEWYN